MRRVQSWHIPQRERPPPGLRWLWLRSLRCPPPRLLSNHFHCPNHDCSNHDCPNHIVQTMIVKRIIISFLVGPALELSHLDSCHLRCRTSRTMSYVMQHYIVRVTYDIVCCIARTMSYVRYTEYRRASYVQYRTSTLYRTSTYDIVSGTYDIVGRDLNISYTMSYV